MKYLKFYELIIEDCNATCTAPYHVLRHYYYTYCYWLILGDIEHKNTKNTKLWRKLGNFRRLGESWTWHGSLVSLTRNLVTKTESFFV